MTEAICKELGIRKNYLGNETIDTIYFGGGTPSILPKEEIQQILDCVNKHFSVSANPEITLEANPDDLDKEKLKNLFDLKINRLSIGVQSFDDKSLKWMNRAHTSSEAIDSIRMAQEIGFRNISIDIITGIPVADEKQHIADLELAFSLYPQHLSCYTLTLEPNTSWERLIRLKHYPKPIEEQQAAAFEETIDFIKSKGWIHYEISNFALSKEWISKHNNSYWNRKLYLGVGPSAHSFNGLSRRWNKTNHTDYIRFTKNNEEPPFDSEIITKTMSFNEAIMTGIRTSNGIDIKILRDILPDESEKLLKKINQEPLINSVHITDGHIVLNESSLLFSDAIASELFV